MRSGAIAVYLFLFALAAFGQGNLGGITGAVSDWEHAPLSDAAIQARNVQSGTVYKAASSAKGDYTLSELPAGTYELSAYVPGMLPYQKKDVAVQAGQTLRLDIRIEELG